MVPEHPRLGPFRIFAKILVDIQTCKFTAGVVVTGNKLSPVSLTPATTTLVIAGNNDTGDNLLTVKTTQCDLMNICNNISLPTPQSEHEVK